jgi:hypothetical protein
MHINYIFVKLIYLDFMVFQQWVAKRWLCIYINTVIDISSFYLV